MPLQRIFERNVTAVKQLAENGCLFICVLFLIGANEFETALKLYNEAVQSGAITEDCYVFHKQLASFLRDKGYRIEFQGFQKTANVNLIIAEFQNLGLSHFVVVDNDDKIVYDPLGDSVTVAEGHLVGYRNYYVPSRGCNT